MAELLFDKQNERVIDWAKQSTAAMKGGANALGITHRANSPSPGASVSKLKERFRYHDGAIEVISFRFPRSLIWTMKGSGKGIGGDTGSSWINKLGIRVHTNPNSLGKLGSSGRKAKPFINNYLDSEQGVPQLATIVAEETGDAIVNSILVK